MYSLLLQSEFPKTKHIIPFFNTEPAYSLNATLKYKHFFALKTSLIISGSFVQFGYAANYQKADFWNIFMLT